MNNKEVERIGRVKRREMIKIEEVGGRELLVLGYVAGERGKTSHIRFRMIISHNNKPNENISELNKDKSISQDSR